MPNTKPITRGFGLCTVPGCNRPRRSSVSPICATHNSRARNNGDPNQSVVTAKELRPWENRVRKAMATGNAELITSSLKEIARRLREYAQSELAQYLRGVPTNRHVVLACDQIEKVTAKVDATETAVSLAALYLMREADPRRFPSDGGFIGQLVRTYRRPAGIARGRTYDSRTGKDIGWFKALPRRTTEELGRLIATAYRPWVLHIRAAHQRLIDDERAVEKGLARAFTAT